MLHRIVTNELESKRSWWNFRCLTGIFLKRVRITLRNLSQSSGSGCQPSRDSNRGSPKYKPEAQLPGPLLNKCALIVSEVKKDCWSYDRSVTRSWTKIHASRYYKDYMLRARLKSICKEVSKTGLLSTRGDKYHFTWRNVNTYLHNSL